MSMLTQGHWGKPIADAGGGWRGLSVGHYIPAVSMLDTSFPGMSAIGFMANIQKMTGEAKELFLWLIRTARTPDEIYLINLMRAQGRSPEQTYAALTAMRQWQAMQQAALPGTAFCSGLASDCRGAWLGGPGGGNVGLIPAQLSSKLQGRTFDNFSHFIREFWKTVAATPELGSQFSAANLARMQAGLSPIAPASQHHGEFSAYMIVHRVPVSSGGALFDMSNMAIVTPLMHQAIMDPRYHPFMTNILHSGHMSMRVALRRRRRRKGKDKDRLTLADFGFGRWARKKWRAFTRQQKRHANKGSKQAQRPVLVGEILLPLRRRPLRRPAPDDLTLTATPLAIA
ncbi:MAG: hypothetical protein HC850_03725 [Rhodomicrobium sp.]|nr:hypothetical protein [Rhodomicrobium sp.]